jgi:beta-N-acetylhexosaminidase
MIARARFVAGLCAAVLVVAGVGRVAAEDPGKDKVDVRGTVSRVAASDDEAKKAGRLGSILVEGVKDATTAYDKASVKVTDKTKIEKLVGKERKAAKFEDLKKGSKVQALFTGPVAESYPVQATAKEILILE